MITVSQALQRRLRSIAKYTASSSSVHSCRVIEKPWQQQQRYQRIAVLCQRHFSTDSGAVAVPSATSFLSHMSAEDKIRLLGRLSPLAQRANTMHKTLTAAELLTPLSVKDSKSLRRITPVASATASVRSLRSDISEAATLLDDPASDAELKTLALDEVQHLASQLDEQAVELLKKIIVVGADQKIYFEADGENDNGDGEDDDNDENGEENGEENGQHDSGKPSVALLEVRAGAGGDEAALFAAELVEMYEALAENQGWTTRVLSRSTTELRGVREAIVRISGVGVLRLMRTEAGVHRVQRVPRTETQGRTHTSTASIAVLTEPSGHNQDSQALLPASEVRIDVYRARGAGGQHVNTTESAVRATHIPTGLVTTCQDERSQHRNRASALQALAAKVFAQVARERAAKRLQTRRKQLTGKSSGGSLVVGERSDRIRTYNFPQKRVTDYRVALL